MKYFFKHLHTVNIHRWEVFKLCCKVGIPIRGLLHDLSKYSYEEFSESVKYFKISNGRYSPLNACKKEVGYSKAWLHHKGRNKHHYEYWHDEIAPIKDPVMPFKYTLEMLCDRIAASKIYNKGNYNNKMPLEYFYKEMKNITINLAIKMFLEETLTKLSKHGEKVLNKKELYQIYSKCVKKYEEEKH